MFRPDFRQLLTKYPELFGDTSTARREPIDWKDADFNRSLTRAILRDEFGVDIELHPGRLCPPIPNR
jgi:23S rRNA A1618 N6-methylase RlmF